MPKIYKLDKEYGINFRYYGDDAASLGFGGKRVPGKMSGSYDIVYPISNMAGLSRREKWATSGGSC